MTTKEMFEMASKAYNSQDPAMLESGYSPMTTFWGDFSVADMFGKKAVVETFNRAFKEWHDNVKFVTELVLVLNHKIWQHWENDDTELSKVYDALWRKAAIWCEDNLSGADADYYYSVTD